MRRATRTLAIIAMTATFMGCASQSTPATTATTSPIQLSLHATEATYPLAIDLARTYSHGQVAIDISTSPFNPLLPNSVADEETIRYLLSLHLNPTYTDRAIPVAQDAILVIASEDVAASNITLEQLRAIYQGRVSDWEAINGQEQPIVTVSRESGSDIRSEFERMVMGRSRISAGARLVTSDVQMIDIVRQTEGAIGYISAGYRDQTMNFLRVDGIDGNNQAIVQGIYPLRTTVYLIGRQPTDVMANDDFVWWVQGQAGQRVISQRYIPLVPLTFDDN